MFHCSRYVSVGFNSFRIYGKLSTNSVGTCAGPSLGADSYLENRQIGLKPALIKKRWFAAFIVTWKLGLAVGFFQLRVHNVIACRYQQKSISSFVISRSLFRQLLPSLIPRSTRAGLTVGQTGQMPGASRFWRLRACIANESFFFSCFEAVHHASKL